MKKEARIQEAGSQESRSQNPEARSQNPEARIQKPEFKNPEFRRQNSEFHETAEVPELLATPHPNLSPQGEGRI